ncbi:Dcc1p KNAG_0I01260 [Huiozyma naganishii CBS 8797]|uniref:Sister chromatid cohesion protein DCC1 n=1 Tax=Huiozyma naganishii (strain ATCC MYA-139 / BCRC 22969 / CBS 8797 / KCTC 17520 / NBRC 10181 / NCYC 3082 / Yp74L-3) TaxID=1071383 RepID=J7S2A1_HUIN7|nr:hypothetical protein KNAG_0I01260 [Kazachstania naganishii CBS 8797]CCK71917.1 hypothetical protein KNAG_0I01260 [Kazachstania naganishii CBS 8797]
MSINLHTQFQYDPAYKLIQLTPELLEILEKNEAGSNTGLQFKSLSAEGTDVVLCSDDKTWLIKQKNHSNTVLLMKEFVPENDIQVSEESLFGLRQPEDNYLAFANTSYEYETRAVEGHLNLNSLLMYDGERDFPLGADEGSLLHSFDELADDSPCSKKECLSQWHQLGGCTISNVLCILSQNFLSKALNITLVSIMSENLPLDDLKLDATYEAVRKGMEDAESSTFSPYSKEVVLTVLNKFGISTKENTAWELDMLTIAKWYGLEALQTYVRNSSLSVDEFLIKWKSLFPAFFPCDIDVVMLRGHYYVPTSGYIQYLSKDTLPSEVKSRFRSLFELQSTWVLEDIEPFIKEFNTKGLKIDNFIMKFAKRKQITDRNRKITITTVTSR